MNAERSPLEELIVELNVFINADHPIIEDDIVEKIMSAFADQEGFQIVISPTSQTIERILEKQKRADEVKDKEIERLKNWCEVLYKDSAKSKLITKGVKVFDYLERTEIDDAWKEFKTENNL